MIDNNLCFDVALYPELVTYGETGQVFQNWMRVPADQEVPRGHDRPPDPCAGEWASSGALRASRMLHV